jgi:hypothetical protein
MLTDIRTALLRTGVLVGEYEVPLAGGDVRNELRSGYDKLPVTRSVYSPTNFCETSWNVSASGLLGHSMWHTYFLH